MSTVILGDAIFRYVRGEQNREDYIKVFILFKTDISLAIRYLHEVCLPPVVHRNFKSANILLDEELNPHLSDCGLAALTPNTERQVQMGKRKMPNRLPVSPFYADCSYLSLLVLQLSTQMVGSFGYSAPEFALSGVYTVKSDVYSFGVVMLELLTGRKPLDRYEIYVK